MNTAFTCSCSRLCRLILMMLLIICMNSYIFARKSSEKSVTLDVNADQEIGQMTPIWTFFGYDEANYTFAPEGRYLLRMISQLNPQPVYIRCHHLLTSGDGSAWLKWSSTNAYTEDYNGNPVYNWEIVDKIFDTYVELGLKPLVEIGFMSEALSSRPQPYTPKKILNEEPVGMVTGGAFYPPRDYAKWKAFIEAWVQHCVDKYGQAEVASWFWELWNEPNIGYWKGTPEEYFKLYDYTVAAIKTVLSQARIGGPHITDPYYHEGDAFLDLFITHCLYGTNYLTGQTGTEIDFFASHAKGGTSWEEDYVQMNLGYHLKQIDRAAEIIASYPEMKDKPLIIGESDPDGCAACSSRLYPQNDYRNGIQYACYTVATFLRKQEVVQRRGLKLIGAVTWAFTFPGQPLFDGYRALTTHGVAKAVFNAFQMFSMLDKTRVASWSSSDISLDSLMKSSARN